MTRVVAPPRFSAASRAGYLQKRASPHALSSIKEHPDSADLDPDEEAASYVLDASSTFTDTRQRTIPSPEEHRRNATEFGVSIVMCRTSCCNTPVHVEHISDDWLQEHSSSISMEGYCPICVKMCTLKRIADPSAHFGVSSPSFHNPSIKTGPLRSALRRRNSRFPPSRSSVPLSPSTRRVRFAPSTTTAQFAPSTTTAYTAPIFCLKTVLDAAYRLFDGDGDEEPYPHTEHVDVLGSCKVVTDVNETFMRLMSVACLTLTFYTLFRH